MNPYLEKQKSVRKKGIQFNAMNVLLRGRLKEKSIRLGVVILGLVIIIAAMIWFRAFYGSMKAYHQGETYLKGQQYIKAMTFFDRSIHWYTPFNPYVRRSVEKLWEIGKDAERKGDTRLALIAFRTIRRGFYASSSFYIPGRDWIKRCDIKINKLIQLEQIKEELPENFKMKGKYITESQRIASPNIYWTIILEIGFLGWIGSVIGFIMFTLRRKEKPKYSTFSTFIWIILTFIFFSLWIVGMMKA